MAYLLETQEVGSSSLPSPSPKPSLTLQKEGFFVFVISLETCEYAFASFLRPEATTFEYIVSVLWVALNHYFMVRPSVFLTGGQLPLCFHLG